MREAARASVAKSRQALQPTTKNIARHTSTRRKSTSVKDEYSTIKDEPSDQSTPRGKRKRFSPATPSPQKSLKKIKTEEVSVNAIPEFKAKDSPSKVKSNSGDLQTKKLKTYAAHANKSPFPDFQHPTPAECKLAHRILADLHGARTRPTELVASTTRAGCGDSPSVLDALVRTILSQNTSDTNSTRAKLSMDRAYGASDKWDAIVEGGQAKLQEAIKCGGLSLVKSKVIINILNQTREKYGRYSLDHLHQASNEEAMQEMIAFQGVGPKTASCVLLFCLQRESFAVDTHVWRISGLLGWRPKSASRDETHAHLDVMVPDEDKYGLHILLVSHGKRCAECKAGGRNSGKCELRKPSKVGKGGAEKDEMEKMSPLPKKSNVKKQKVDR